MKARQILTMRHVVFVSVGRRSWHPLSNVKVFPWTSEKGQKTRGRLTKKICKPPQSHPRMAPPIYSILLPRESKKGVEEGLNDQI
jgi:hypothetical protein